MASSKVAAILLLIVVALAALVTAYYVSRRTILSFEREESLAIEKLTFNRRVHVLCDVKVRNVGELKVKIVRVMLEKIETGLVLYDKHVDVELGPGEEASIELNFKVDPEGADYRLYVITAENRAAIKKFGYPTEISELGY